MNAIEWTGRELRLLDQTKLPLQIEWHDCRTAADVASAIRTMVVRGAPAIGVAAAYGMVLAAAQAGSLDPAAYQQAMLEAADLLKAARPTAVNLAWATDRMLALASELAPDEAFSALEVAANRLAADDIRVNQLIGQHGATLIPDQARILTHCNTGALATVGYGTALGVIRAAVDAGKQVEVFADETRPYLQGSRLTVLELMQDDIPVTLITDSMAGWLMALGRVDLVIVGADRVAGNGDVANKIGTYSLAVLARHHGIPFYVACPVSTLDSSLADGNEILIEERAAEEVTHFGGVRIAPEGTSVWNPAFDVTPHDLVTALITEKGVVYPPYTEGLARLLGQDRTG